MELSRAEEFAEIAKDDPEYFADLLLSSLSSSSINSAELLVLANKFAQHEVNIIRILDEHPEKTEERFGEAIVSDGLADRLDEAIEMYD